jgi:hypothetical protein
VGLGRRFDGRVRGIALLVQILIGAAAYFVLIDVTHFAYKTYWQPALAKRRRK